MLGLDTRWELHSRGDGPSRNRYLYTGRDTLYRLPSSLGDIWRDGRTIEGLMAKVTSHLAKRLKSLVFHPPWMDGPQPADQSIGEVASFWFGPEFVDQIVSAIVHGVTAGDPFKLSMRAFNESAYLKLANFLSPKSQSLKPTARPFERENRELFERWKETAQFEEDPGFQEPTMMYLKGGMAAIPGALEASLRLSGSVDIKRAKVTKLSMDDDGQRVLVSDNAC
jgi:protoporphyrinogen/coproporphyrinogen III oxidase